MCEHPIGDDFLMTSKTQSRFTVQQAHDREGLAGVRRRLWIGLSDDRASQAFDKGARCQQNLLRNLVSQVGNSAEAVRKHPNSHAIYPCPSQSPHLPTFVRDG